MGKDRGCDLSSVITGEWRREHGEGLRKLGPESDCWERCYDHEPFASLSLYPIGGGDDESVGRSRFFRVGESPFPYREWRWQGELANLRQGFSNPSVGMARKEHFVLLSSRKAAFWQDLAEMYPRTAYFGEIDAFCTL